MRITCPQCDKTLNVPDVAGKKFRCPGCKTVVTVPETPRQTRPDDEMCCPRCKATDLHPLPRNVFTRRPGYGCPDCGLFMRHPGTTGGNVFAIAMGVFLIVVSLAATFGAIQADDLRRDGVVGGAVSMCVLAATVIAWGVFQLRKPEPLNAPPQRSYWWVWLLVLLVILLAVGGGFVGVMYYLQEML